MPKEQSYDGEIAGMRKSMEKMAEAATKQALHTERIATLQEVYVEQIKTCSGETKDNTKAIASMKVKQNIITYVASGGFLAVIGGFVRQWFK